MLAHHEVLWLSGVGTMFLTPLGIGLSARFYKLRRIVSLRRRSTQRAGTSDHSGGRSALKVIDHDSHDVVCDRDVDSAFGERLEYDAANGDLKSAV